MRVTDALVVRAVFRRSPIQVRDHLLQCKIGRMFYVSLLCTCRYEPLHWKSILWWLNVGSCIINTLVDTGLWLQS